MPELPPSPTLEPWVYVSLIWVGFGALAGILAGVILPIGRIGPLTTLAAGLSGSTLGLTVLNGLFPDAARNPISPLGFLAATVGAFVLLTLFRTAAIFLRHGEDQIEDERP